MERPGRILVVDDISFNRDVLAALLECMGHEIVEAEGGKAALSLLSPAIDLVLLDVSMPDMDGYEVARLIRQRPDVYDLPIIMVTALSSREDRLEAVRSGASDFITKPVDKIELAARTASLLKIKRAQDAIKRHERELEAEVARQTARLQQALKLLEAAALEAQQAALETVRRLAIAAEYRDEDTAAHLHRVSLYSAMIGRLLGLPGEQLDLLFHAAPMHDVGKIGIPDAILLSTASLSPKERAIMEQHTILGARILTGSTSPLLQAGETIALAHHEKWDGTGYPHGLSGEDIPLFARICAIGDVFDALTTPRPYKPAYSNETAFQILREGRGTHFDPRLLDLFLGHPEEIEAIQQVCREETQAKLPPAHTPTAF